MNQASINSARVPSYAPLVRVDSAARQVGAQDLDADRRSPRDAGLPAVSDPAHPPFRPVQFLGAKTRILNELSEEALRLLGPGAHVLDAFSGSSLVAQQMARVGFSVTATDALEHCVHFARALLGVGKPDEPLTEVPSLLPDEKNWVEPWEPWLRRERAAIVDRDSDALIRLAEATPQIWRPINASPRLARSFEMMRPGETHAGIVSAHYAGTYFGVIQAVEIDCLRSCIAKSLQAGLIGPWEESVLLTALLSAASDCAFSAGKHYAQPHRIRSGKDLSFIRSRILSDRVKEVDTIFAERLERTIQAAGAAGSGHSARCVTVEEHAKGRYLLGKFKGVYADPPYTAQQYSRFYHVPEIICTNRVPRLQKVQGKVTRGIYSDERFNSAYCSRRRAKAAFDDLIQLVRTHGAFLMLSYSGTRSGKTGNARAVSLDDLRSLLRGAFGRRNVVERELTSGYRQFNKHDSSVSGRDDYELLFVGRPNA